MFRALMFFWLSLVWMSSFAQTLTVHVFEKGTRIPVSGATVVLNGSDRHDLTNEKGRVLFEDVTLPLEVKTIAMDYETTSVPVKEGEIKKIVYVMPLHISQDGMLVIADRIEEKTSKFILSQAELRRVPGSSGDPIKAVQSLPGVISAGEGSGDVYIRGSGDGDQGAWVNNIPVSYIFHIGDVSTINPDLIEDFNLFLGGFPVEYPDQIGGFLDIKLRKPRTDRYYQDYRVAINEAAFLVEGPVGNRNNGFYIAARRSYIDAIFSPQDLTDLINADKKEGELQNVITTVPRYHDMQAVWHRQTVHGSMLLQYLNAADEIALLNNTAKETSPEAAGQLHVKTAYHSLGFNWNQQLGKAWYAQSVLSHILSDQDQKIGANRQTGEPYFAKVTERQYRWQPELHWQASGADRFKLGVEATYGEYPLSLYISQQNTENDVDFDFTLQEKYRIKDTFYARFVAPFVKYTRQWNTRLKSSIGLRYTRIYGSGDFDMRGTSPRMRVEYALLPATVLSAVWGRYMQMPATESQLLEGFGNPRLQMTDAQHRILGIKHQFNSRWSLQAEAFHTPVKKLSIRVEGAAPPDNYTNKGSGENYGVDIMLKRESQNGRGGWLSYSYIDSTRKNELTGVDREYTGNIPHVLTMVWTQPFSGTWRSVNWGVKLQMHSGRPHTPVIGRSAMCFDNAQYQPCADQVQAQEDPTFSHFTPRYAKQNSDRFPFYYRLDVRFEKEARFNRWLLNMYLDLQNVTFSDNIIGYDYGSKYQRIDNPKEIRSQPFIPYLGVEFKF